MIIKNTTNSNIDLIEIGIQVPANGSYTVQTTDILLIYSNESVIELTPYINSGDLVFNDGSDLSAEKANIILNYPFQSSSILFNNDSNGFISTNIQSAIEEAKDASDTKTRFTVTLSHDNDIKDKTYVGYSKQIPGNKAPIVFPKNCVLEEVVISNEKEDSLFTLSFKHGSTSGVEFHQIIKSDNNNNIHIDTDIYETINAGEPIYIKYTSDNNKKTKDIVITLYLRNL